MSDPYAPGSGDTSYSVLRYELDLDYRTATNALLGSALLHVQPREPLRRLVLDLIGLHVDSVRVDGRRTRHRHVGSRLSVDVPETDAPLTVEVRYGGRPRPRRGTWGEVGWEELTDGALVAGQPNGAPTWFPCNDRPSDKASYGITVRTESDYTVVANGVLVARDRGSSRTAWVFEQGEPTPSYLATVQVGRYEPHDLASGHLLWSPPRLRVAARAATARLPEMAECFAGHFGPYPFTGHTVVVTDDPLEIPLEAQGVSVLGANHVDGQHERLVAHELAHQWFGNSLTVGAWRDIWLHEGFACYAEWLWSESSGRATADEQARLAHARLQALPQDLVVSDPGPVHMFDDRVYKRGALAVHALRRAAGEREFAALLRSWVALHRHGTVSTEAFRQHVGRLAQVLPPWLDEPGLPPL